MTLFRVSHEMKILPITLWMIFLVLASQSIAGEGEKLGLAGTSKKDADCRPGYVFLDSSSRSRGASSARTTMALIGCQADLERLSKPELIAVEEELLRMADTADWWKKGSLASQAQKLARGRVSELLKGNHPIDVFFHSSAGIPRHPKASNLFETAPKITQGASSAAASVTECCYDANDNLEKIWDPILRGARP